MDEKNACFDSIATVMIENMSAHKDPELIFVIVNELHINTITVFVGASYVKALVLDSALYIWNLVGTAFLQSNDNISKIPKSLNIMDRVIDTMYLRVSYNIDVFSIEKRISQDIY